MTTPNTPEMYTFTDSRAFKLSPLADEWYSRYRKVYFLSEPLGALEARGLKPQEHCDFSIPFFSCKDVVMDLEGNRYASVHDCLQALQAPYPEYAAQERICWSIVPPPWVKHFASMPDLAAAAQEVLHNYVPGNPCIGDYYLDSEHEQKRFAWRSVEDLRALLQTVNTSAERSLS